MHTPGQIRSAAKSLLIDKVSPAAHSLADEKPQRGNIQHSRHLHFADLGHQAAKDHGADQPAVNGQAAVVNLENFHGIFQIFVSGIKDHIKQPGKDHTGNQADDHYIKKPVDVNVHLFAAEAGISQRQQKSYRDDDSIPVNVKAANGKSHCVYCKFQAKVWKGDLMSHVKVLLTGGSAAFL